MTKPVKLLLIFLLFPIAFYAQTTLTGLWMGTLSNDSNTVRKNQTYEIALTEYRGKVYGYSRMNFFVNDTLYYIVKRLKGTVEGDICEVKDDDIITHNFPRQPEKGVKMISTFRRSLTDSVWRLDGEWRTTETRKHRYYAISGKISLNAEPDFSKSKIFPHLEELKLADDVAFYAATKKKEDEVTSSTSLTSNHTTKAADKMDLSKKAGTDTESSQARLSKDQQSLSAVSNRSNNPAGGTAPTTRSTASVSNNKQVTEQIEEAPAFSGLKKTDGAISRPATQHASDLNKASQSPVVKSSEPNVRLNEIKPPVTTEEKKRETESVAVLMPAANSQVATTTGTRVLNLDPVAAFIKERKTIAPQVVEFINDSLEIKLYDNGEVDGDTVSILMNGTVLMAKQGLKASAIRKTIYIPKDSDEITLVLYAENLGKYPPNTGLVVIRDGEEDYQIRFSADLRQNAAITLRRKK